MSTEAGDALNLSAGVGLCVEGKAASIVFLTLAEVDTTSQFTDDVKVYAAADFRAQRGALD